MIFDDIPSASRTDKLCALAFAGIFLTAHLAVWAMDSAAYQAAELNEPPAVVETVAPVTAEALVEAVEARIDEEYREDIPLPRELQEVLREACEISGVPLDLALGLIEVESGFQVDADNGVSQGLMQINAKYAWKLEEETGYPCSTPEGNIRCGVWYLSQLIEKCNGDQMAALRCYNLGHDDGNREYSQKVMKASEKWGVG